jgi:hypothetical protein
MNMGNMGMKPQKPTPQLFNVDLKHYDDAMAWVRTFFAVRGYYIARAVLDPYVEVWFLYERDGAFITALSHDFIDDIAERIYDGKRDTPGPK